MFVKKIIIVIAAFFVAALLNSSPITNSQKISLMSWLGGTYALAEEALKAGMVDPKTGKKIKYWVAPMDPTYIRNEPGKSPMGMNLVPVYEEEGGEKEPTSNIRIDPVTRQNMGIRLGHVKKDETF